MKSEKKLHRNASALGHEVLDGLDRGTDTGVVGDGLAVKGHVKVAAHENLMKHSQFSGAESHQKIITLSEPLNHIGMANMPNKNTSVAL